MSGPNPIESLRRLSPSSDAEAAAVFGVAGAEDLLSDVLRLPFGRRERAHHSTRRRRPIVIAFAVVVVLGMTAATWAIFRTPARQTTSIECVIAGTDTIIPSISGDPTHDCAVTWKRDVGTAAPSLVAYDNGSGGVTVIPRAETPPKSWTPLQSQDVALIELQDSLDDYIGGLDSSCLDAAAATRLADAKLAEFGFSDWTVTVRNEAGACVTADYVEPAKQTVTLIPTGPPLGSATPAQKLAAELRPVTQTCQSLSTAEASVRSAARDAGVSDSEYQLNAVGDGSLPCAEIYETVGGTISVTIRGPRG
jgi:hypothetical protein